MDKDKQEQDSILWTEDETEQLINFWNNEGKSSGEIGVILGKTPMSVISKIRRLRTLGVNLIMQTRWGERNRQQAYEDKEYRKCLKCQKKFLSDHALNRICKRCTEVNARVYVASIMRVLK